MCNAVRLASAKKHLDLQVMKLRRFHKNLNVKSFHQIQGLKLLWIIWRHLYFLLRSTCLKISGDFSGEIENYNLSCLSKVLKLPKIVIDNPD